jgi:hypothetical protein
MPSVKCPLKAEWTLIAGFKGTCKAVTGVRLRIADLCDLRFADLAIRSDCVSDGAGDEHGAILRQMT